MFCTEYFLCVGSEKPVGAEGEEAPFRKRSTWSGARCCVATAGRRWQKGSWRGNVFTEGPPDVLHEEQEEQEEKEEEGHVMPSTVPVISHSSGTGCFSSTGCSSPDRITAIASIQHQ